MAMNKFNIQERPLDILKIDYKVRADLFALRYGSQVAKRIRLPRLTVQEVTDFITLEPAATSEEIDLFIEGHLPGRRPFSTPQVRLSRAEKVARREEDKNIF